MTQTKKYMTGVYSDLHFICELNENSRYCCIPKYSGGNRTDMTFFATDRKAKFFDTLDEAMDASRRYNDLQAGIREENYLTGKTDRQGRWTKEY